MRQKRDIYKKYTDEDYRPGMDIDCEDLRYILSKDGDLTYAENERFGCYALAIVDVLLGNPHFVNYCENVRENLSAAIIYDVLRLKGKFKSEEYPRFSAPFSFCFRVAYNACSRWLKAYYQRRNAIDDAVPYSMLNKADMVEYQRLYTQSIGGYND